MAYENMPDLISKIPMTLFNYVIILDVWPNEGETIMLNYSGAILSLALKSLSKYGIFPLVYKPMNRHGSSFALALRMAYLSL